MKKLFVIAAIAALFTACKSNSATTADATVVDSTSTVVDTTAAVADTTIAE